MAEQTFADFIARDRERLHAEREQIFNQQHDLEEKLAAIKDAGNRRLRSRQTRGPNRLHSWRRWPAPPSTAPGDVEGMACLFPEMDLSIDDQHLVASSLGSEIQLPPNS